MLSSAFGGFYIQVLRRIDRTQQSYGAIRLMLTWRYWMSRLVIESVPRMAQAASYRDLFRQDLRIKD